ncbi:FMN-binding protein [Anoxynatronum buryatiense]|uniref:Ion-translocating oxidoreductase complex subunit G n=1 Tax=Anoxynatronum buryatiense TaxID=489973 RepID=A0AA45WV54_9CLOT|nr:FMN-binding protein [Anoxynatronum buryatiense]SMP49799.1 electron transport complex protein RnfG [Anoxynatronum buryatiense]
MRDMIKMGLILLLITSIAGLVLGITNSMTEGIILERAMAGDIASMQVLLSEADSFEPVDHEEISASSMIKEVYAGYKGGDLVGFTIKVAPGGYGGPIEMMVGIDATAEITGIEILEQTETPGLGTKITEESYKTQFTGLTADSSIAVDTIAGATVSSEAVNNGVRAAAALYEDILNN